MALQKAIEVQDTGVMVNYHRVTFFAVDWASSQGRIGMVGYVDQAARDAGKGFVKGSDLSVILGPQDILALKAMDIQALIANSSDPEEVLKTAAYLYMKTQQIQNPEHASDPSKPEFIPGPFADAVDV